MPTAAQPLLGTAASVFVLAWAGLPGAALAQAAPAASDTDAGDEEIIVTAQNREQNVLDVGISVAAMSQQDLSEQRIQELQRSRRASCRTLR